MAQGSGGNSSKYGGFGGGSFDPRETSPKEKKKDEGTLSRSKWDAEDDGFGAAFASLKDESASPPPAAAAAAAGNLFEIALRPRRAVLPLTASRRLTRAFPTAAEAAVSAPAGGGGRRALWFDWQISIRGRERSDGDLASRGARGGGGGVTLGALPTPAAGLAPPPAGSGPAGGRRPLRCWRRRRRRRRRGPAGLFDAMDAPAPPPPAAAAAAMMMGDGGGVMGLTAAQVTRPRSGPGPRWPALTPPLP